jgi:hypothetical protein
MAIKLNCPTCGAKLKAADAAAGRPLDCPHCAQAVAVPSVAASLPAAAGRGESAAAVSRRRPSGAPHMAPNPHIDAVIDAYEDRRAHARAEADVEDAAVADRIGFAGIMFAAASAACLVMGIFTCGLTYWLAAPVALAGAGCSAVSQSRLRAIGLVANLLILVPAGMTFKAAWTVVTAPAPEPQPFLR